MTRDEVKSVILKIAKEKYDPDPAIPNGTYLPTKTVGYPQDVCLNNSFAFGGTNVVLALAK